MKVIVDTVFDNHLPEWWQGLCLHWVLGSWQKSFFVWLFEVMVGRVWRWCCVELAMHIEFWSVLAPCFGVYTWWVYHPLRSNVLLVDW